MAEDDERVRLEDPAPEGVRLARIDRPEKRNALDGPTREALLDALDRAVDEGARAVVLAGTEGTFAAGADLAEMQERSVDEQRAFLKPPRMYEAVEALERPVVAAVNGHALGAGLELALACDVRVAASDAKLGSPEVRLGLIPGGGGTQRLPRLVGMGDAMRLVLTGDAVEASEAEELGLVQAVADDAEGAAVEMAGRMARWSPVALSRAKRALREAWRTPLAEGLGREVDAFAEAFASRDAEEGIAAFLEDREPTFTGE